MNLAFPFRISFLICSLSLDGSRKPTWESWVLGLLFFGIVIEVEKCNILYRISLKDRCNTGENWMQNSSDFLTKNERKLIDSLRDGTRQYTEIVDALKKNCVKERTANNLLNRLVEAKKIFRVEINGNVFYRLNDFPLEVRGILALIDALPDSPFKSLISSLKPNIITFYGKLTLSQIADLTEMEVKTQLAGDKLSRESFQKLKEAL